jgi:diguanylate cyclase (GGDEF)-like protein
MADEQHTSTIAFMREIFAYLGSSKSTYNLLNSIHESLKTVLYADNFFVVLLSSSERYVTFPYYQDVTDSLCSDDLNLVPLEELFNTLTFYAMKKKKVVQLTREEIEGLVEQGELKVLGTMPEQWLCFPLQHHGDFLGNFVVQSYRSNEEYTQHDVDVLTLISHVIAAALSLFKRNAQLSEALEDLNQHKDHLEIKVQQRTQELETTLNSLKKEVSKSKELEQQLKFLAFHDSLTSLYNRKYFLDQMEVIASKSGREKTQVFVAFLDLDGFKAINDNYGHACGDHVLKITASRLNDSFRRHDIVARFGGDEFTILINSVIADSDLEALLSRVIKELSSDIYYQEHIVNVGVSIGVAQSDSVKVNTCEMLEQADKALYQAKSQGKGCFVFNSELINSELKTS